MDTTIVELRGVTKTFSGKPAVQDISLTISQGSVVAILGPNGAGKTTALSMMLGLMEPTQGSVKIFKQHPKQVEVRRRIGAMLQEVSVIDGLKVREVIALIRSYYPHPLELSELASLAGFSATELNKRAEKLSGGQKRRLGFALAMAGNPDLLFFDEPTVGLDTTSRRAFWQQVHSLADQGKTIIFSTHYLQEAEDSADRIIVFNQGKIAADGPPEEIISKLTSQSVSFIVDQTAALAIDIREQMLSIPGVRDCYESEGRWVVTTDNTDVVLAAIFKHQIPARNIRIDHGRLDDAFEQMIHTHGEAVS